MIKKDVPINQQVSKKTHDLIQTRIAAMAEDLQHYLREQAKNKGEKENDIQGAASEETLRTNQLCALKRQLKGKTVIVPVYQNKTIALGSRVVWSQAGKEDETVVIDGVGYQDKENDIKIINVSTPVGKTLIGKKKGDIIRNLSGMVMTIKEVKYP